MVLQKGHVKLFFMDFFNHDFFVVDLCSNPTGCQCLHLPGDELHHQALVMREKLKLNPAPYCSSPFQSREFLQLILPTSISNNDNNHVLT